MPSRPAEVVHSGLLRHPVYKSDIAAHLWRARQRDGDLPQAPRRARHPVRKPDGTSAQPALLAPSTKRRDRLSTVGYIEPWSYRALIRAVVRPHHLSDSD